MIWIFLTLLWLLSMVFVTYFYYKPLKNNQAILTNVEIAKEKIRQLEQDRLVVACSDEDFNEAKNDILKMLTLDEEKSKTQLNENKQSKVFLGFVAIFSLVILLSSYFSLGNPKHTIIKKPQPSIDSLLVKMEQHLEKNPTDIKAWSMLGQTYFSMQQLEKANIAFTKAYELDPNNEDIILSLASGLAAMNGNRLLGKPIQLIQSVLEKNPNSVKALWLAGYAIYQEGNYELAQVTWERTYALMSEADPERKMIAQYIKDIKRLQKERNSDSKITVFVSLADNIKADKTDFVMVYARTPTGMKMPVAIQKIRVSDLPATIILTDLDAAMPTRKLSQMKEVLVFVRLSKTGQAVQQAGDIIVQSKIVNPKNKPEITLRIK
jgi:cytochrome c-type biogenesis protein CcmH